jgi:hypothetical protein
MPGGGSGPDRLRRLPGAVERIRFGQYSRITNVNGPAGAGSQLACFSGEHQRFGTQVGTYAE